MVQGKAHNTVKGVMAVGEIVSFGRTPGKS